LKSVIEMLEVKELEEQIRNLERRELEGGAGSPTEGLGTEGYASLLALTLLQDYRVWL